MPSKIKNLRDYQIAALIAIRETFASGADSALCVLPTGMGKTVLFARLASEWTEGTVMIVAHRIELIDQAAEKLESELGYKPICIQGERKFNGFSETSIDRVFCGSIQTLRFCSRLTPFEKRPLGLLIIDEAHHATAKSYQKLQKWAIECNPDCKILGVTATPKRGDGSALGIVFHREAFAMDLEQGIGLGWLVDIHQEFVEIGEVNFDTVGTKKNDLGEKDFNQGDLEILMTRDEVLYGMSKAILDKCKLPNQAIIFTAGVKHAHSLAAILNAERPECAEAIDGTTDKFTRSEVLNRFRDGKLEFLLNYGVFTEGFDAPTVTHIFMGRPTKSASLYTQMLGRGTRPLPGVVDGLATPEERQDAILASAKPNMLVVDFVGNSKHQPVSAVDILGGNYSPEVRKTVSQGAKGGGKNVIDSLAKEKAWVEYTAEKKLRAAIKAKASYVSKEIPVFGNKQTRFNANRTAPRGGATDAQIGFLIGLGISPNKAASFSKGQAGAVISDLKKTRCTEKQKGILRKFGLDSTVNFEAAKVLIDAIAANGWRPLTQEVGK